MLTFKEFFNLIILNEFSEGAIKKIIAKFQNDASEQEIRREVADFEKYKNSFEKKDPFQYKSWIEFTEAIHGAKGKAQFKNKKPVEQDITANQDDIIADDENVTIYRGDTEEKCVMYGHGYTFCIARPRGGNMFHNYRTNKESTFYFIYFKKKPKTDPDHIMVLDHTRDGYEWTFADNNTQRVQGGWDEIIGKYPEIAKYKNVLVNKKLTEEERIFLSRIKDFRNEPTLEKFNTFSYKEKAQVLKATLNLPDEIWQVLDSALRNEFLAIGPNLTNYQADDLKSNEIERYKKTREITFKELTTINGDDEDDFGEDGAEGIVDPETGEPYIRVNKYDSLESVASSPAISFYYAKNLTQEKMSVPDAILKGIASVPSYAGSYARNVLEWKNVPGEIMKAILSDPQETYYYAQNVFWGRKAPEEIIKIISTSPYNSYYYAKDLTQEKMSVPDAILKGIASDPEYAYFYATDLNWKNVPDVIMKSIASKPGIAYSYVRAGYEAPDIIMKSIISDPEYAYLYAKEVLDWKNVPEEVMKSIISGNLRLPDDVKQKYNIE
jgi:hypothetical protein